MKKRISIKFISFAVALIFAACGNSTEKRVKDTYEGGLPKTVEYFAIKDDGTEEKVKEIRFFPNGEKEIEGEYLNGKKHGKWTQWHDNGNKWSEELFEENIRHGSFTIWYANGNVNYEGYYKNGTPDGKWTFNDNEGRKQKTILYENGIKQTEESY